MVIISGICGGVEYYLALCTSGVNQSTLTNNTILKNQDYYWREKRVCHLLLHVADFMTSNFVFKEEPTNLPNCLYAEFLHL